MALCLHNRKLLKAINTRSSYYNAPIHVCLNVCLIHIQIYASVRNISKCSTLTDEDLGRVLTGVVCDYLPRGRCYTF